MSNQTLRLYLTDTKDTAPDDRHELGIFHRFLKKRLHARLDGAIVVGTHVARETSGDLTLDGAALNYNLRVCSTASARSIGSRIRRSYMSQRSMRTASICVLDIVIATTSGINASAANARTSKCSVSG